VVENRATIFCMARRRASPPPKLVWLVLCLAVGLTAGCARPTAVHHSEPATNSPLPSKTSLSIRILSTPQTKALIPQFPWIASREAVRPFRRHRNAHSLPAGTLLTVRLDKSLSIPQVRPGDTFTASVAVLSPLTEIFWSNVVLRSADA